MGHRPNPYYVLEEKKLTMHKSTLQVTMGDGALEQLKITQAGKLPSFWIPI